MGQFVVAQTIGKIIASDGTFTIYNKDNRSIAGDSIELTDRVIVDENAQVDILVHDSFVAQVFGPAQFEIILNEDLEGYNLKFINGGDNIAINSVNESSKNISIQTSDGVVIKNNEKSQKLSFSVQKKPGESERSVINQSTSSLEISDTQNNTDQKVVVQAKHSMNFMKDDKANNIQIISQQEIIDTPLIVENQQPSKGKPQNITPENIPHIITRENIKTIKQVLTKEFLNSEYNDLVTYYLIGQDNEYTTTLANINKRLNRLAVIANVEQQKTHSLSEIIAYINTIIQGFEEYGLDPTYYQNLNIMIQKLDELPHHEYGVLQQTHQKKPVDISFIRSIISFNPNNNYL